MGNITKDVLKNSLVHLLEVEPLDKITIKDIVDDCHLNRNTFYYHFHDIYDLVDYLFFSEAHNLIHVENIEEDWQEDVVKLTDYLTSHKRMIYHIYYSISREHLELYLYKVINQVLVKLFQQVSNNRCEMERIKYVAEFYTYAFTGKILDWIKNGMRECPNELLRQLKIVFEPVLDDFRRIGQIKKSV